ncbi:MAG TPA: DUF6644 family protein [Bryobacteraceae bacterium]|jgi:hypothetical protein|nr:DUF6644 family protein [Bryobacteraceae bacterium]
MSLLPLFEWLGRTSLGAFMQQSGYAFPMVEMVHLLALAILGGAILIIDLRLLGLGLKSLSAERLAQELTPYLTGCLIASAVSGLLLLSGEPLKCYYNLAFRLKMLFLAVAVLFYFVVQKRIFQFEREGRRELLQKLTGVVSLLLWLAVGLAGRAIGVI